MGLISCSVFKDKILDGTDVVDPSHEGYRPSNGSEGMGFIDYWCEDCDRDKDKTKGCRILMTALIGSTPHWIKHGGQGICTSFVLLKKVSKSTIEQTAQRSLERKGQLNLLNQS